MFTIWLKQISNYDNAAFILLPRLYNIHVWFVHDITIPYIAAPT